MKNSILLISIITIIILLVTGCEKDVATMLSQGTRRDIFRETVEGERIPSGYAELTIVSSLKTHKPGIYRYGNKVRGTPDYVLLINIDGQTTVIKGDLIKEKTEPKGLSDPEAGEGIRYLFKKEILLTAGKHRLFVALQGERVVIKRELTFKDGTTNILRLEPIYGSSNPEGSPGRGSLGSSSFMAGIAGFWVYLNGGDI